MVTRTCPPRGQSRGVGPAGGRGAWTRVVPGHASAGPPSGRRGSTSAGGGRGPISAGEGGRRPHSALAGFRPALRGPRGREKEHERPPEPRPRQSWRCFLLSGGIRQLSNPGPQVGHLSLQPGETNPTLPIPPIAAGDRAGQPVAVAGQLNAADDTALAPPGQASWPHFHARRPEGSPQVGHLSLQHPGFRSTGDRPRGKPPIGCGKSARSYGDV